MCEPSLCFVFCPLSTHHLPFFGLDVHIFLLLQTLAFSIFIVSTLVCWCQRVAQRTTEPQYTPENSKQQAPCGLVVTHDLSYQGDTQFYWQNPLYFRCVTPKLLFTRGRHKPALIINLINFNLITVLKVKEIAWVHSQKKGENYQLRMWGLCRAVMCWGLGANPDILVLKGLPGLV